MCKIEEMQAAMTAAAEKKLLRRTQIKRNFEISTKTKELKEAKQKAYEDGRTDDIKSLKKQIRKSVARDRQEFRLQNFEEELWFDIKQAKAAHLRGTRNS